MRTSSVVLALFLAAIACGGRTPLAEDETATGDASIDNLVDRAEDSPLGDVPDARSQDAAFDGPWATCTVCSAGLNVNEPPVTSCGQGALWLALEMPIPCDRFAATVAVHSTTGALRIFADDGTRRPGKEIVGATKTFNVKPGWVGISPNLKLAAGTYWIALSVNGLGGGGTTCAFAKSGVINEYYGSFGDDKWEGPYSNPLMIEISDCD